MEDFEILPVPNQLKVRAARNIGVVDQFAGCIAAGRLARQGERYLAAAFGFFESAAAASSAAFDSCETIARLCRLLAVRSWPMAFLSDACHRGVAERASLREFAPSMVMNRRRWQRRIRQGRTSGHDIGDDDVTIVLAPFAGFGV